MDKYYLPASHPYGLVSLHARTGWCWCCTTIGGNGGSFNWTCETCDGLFECLHLLVHHDISAIFHSVLLLMLECSTRVESVDELLMCGQIVLLLLDSLILIAADTGWLKKFRGCHDVVSIVMDIHHCWRWLIPLARKIDVVAHRSYVGTRLTPVERMRSLARKTKRHDDGGSLWCHVSSPKGEEIPFEW